MCAENLSCARRRMHTPASCELISMPSCWARTFCLRETKKSGKKRRIGTFSSNSTDHERRTQVRVYSRTGLSFDWRSVCVAGACMASTRLVGARWDAARGWRADPRQARAGLSALDGVGCRNRESNPADRGRCFVLRNIDAARRRYARVRPQSAPTSRAQRQLLDSRPSEWREQSGGSVLGEMTMSKNSVALQLWKYANARKKRWL